jgi:glutathione S-transferase
MHLGKKIRSIRRDAARTNTRMKLYRFRYSPYARKVQALLDLLGARYDVVEVPYADRNEIATVTGGYIYVPVLIDDAGKVITESRNICEHLLSSEAASSLLVPPPFEGPIWAYADFVDGPLEDVMFRIGSPAVRHSWPTPGERALYVLVKERKFGAGCVDLWARQRVELLDKAHRLLRPTLSTLGRQAFLFGSKPTLADAALYGVCKMLEEADARLLGGPLAPLLAFERRLEEHAARHHRGD